MLVIVRGADHCQTGTGFVWEHTIFLGADKQLQTFRSIPCFRLRPYCYAILSPFLQVFQEIWRTFRRNSINSFRRFVALSIGVLDGVSRNDAILKLQRRWSPTYQDTGRTGTGACDVLGGC